MSRYTYNNMKQKSLGVYIGIIMCIALVGLFAGGIVVHAQGAVSGGVQQLYDPLNSSGPNPLSDLLQRIISYLTMIATPIIAGMVVWGGIQMLIAQDNETKFKKGISTVKHAVYGAVIVILSDGILLVVKSFIGLK